MHRRDVDHRCGHGRRGHRSGPRPGLDHPALLLLDSAFDLLSSFFIWTYRVDRVVSCLCGVPSCVPAKLIDQYFSIVHVVRRVCMEISAH